MAEQTINPATPASRTPDALKKNKPEVRERKKEPRDRRRSEAGRDKRIVDTYA